MLAMSAGDYRTNIHALPLPEESLQSWLQGHWSLLFSHPDDFASYGFEADRWIVHLKSAFESNSTRAMALGGDEGGWIAEVGGRFISARELTQVVRDQLRGIGETMQRFVIVLDDSLRVNHTFSYKETHRLPSPIEMVQAVGMLAGQVGRQ